MGCDLGLRRRELLLTAAAAAWGLASESVSAAQDRYVVLSPEETVELEHDDRMVRLRRSVDRLGLRPAPRFSTTRVPAERMPANFRVETPVLRAAFSERTFFETASWDILPTGRLAIAAVAEALRGEAADAAVFVAGHTDNWGGETYNDNLSMRRADAVAEALYRLGVGDVALWRVGFGESAPLYANDDDEHRAFNRRVEFLFGARVEPVVDVLSRQDVCIAATEAAVAQCIVDLPAPRNVEAVQLTRRPVGVGLDGRPVTRGTTSRSGSASAGAPRGRAVAVETPARLSIPLIRSHGMAAPRR